MSRGKNGAAGGAKGARRATVAAPTVIPDGSGDVAPVGAGIQVDIEGRLAENGIPIAQGGAFGACVGKFDYSSPGQA